MNVVEKIKYSNRQSYIRKGDPKSYTNYTPTNCSQYMTREKSMKSSLLQLSPQHGVQRLDINLCPYIIVMYWVNMKFSLGFPSRCYRKGLGMGCISHCWIWSTWRLFGFCWLLNTPEYRWESETWKTFQKVLLQWSFHFWCQGASHCMSTEALKLHWKHKFMWGSKQDWNEVLNEVLGLVREPQSGYLPQRELLSADSSLSTLSDIVFENDICVCACEGAWGT